MTERSPELAGLIQELYASGLSRSEIKTVLSKGRGERVHSRVSDRYVKEITKSLKGTDSEVLHRLSQRETRLDVSSLSLSRKDSGTVYTSKMTGRGMKKLSRRGVGDKNFSDWFWAHRKSVEGSSPAVLR